MIRFGIIGLGKMGLIRAHELKANPHAELVAVADSDTARFDDFPGVECSQDPSDVIRSNVDAVIVCTPNQFTSAIVVEALEAKKHVFCEKPPGKSLEDIRKIREAESRVPKCKLMFGFNHRKHAGIQEAKRIVESGRLGQILWVRGIYGKSGGPNFEESWRSSREVCGGGILLDQGIHMLDLFRFFCGEFVEVKSMVETAYWNIDVEDNAFALLRSETGQVGMLHSTSTQWKHRFNLELCLTEGSLSVNGILSSTRSYGDETITVASRTPYDEFAFGKPREEVIYFDKDPSWEQEMTEFVECILEDKEVTSSTSDDAFRAMELVDAIYRNADKNPSGEEN